MRRRRRRREITAAKRPESRRDGDGPTRSSNKKKRMRPFEGVWSGLGKEDALKLCRSVVSLALSDGNTVLFSFSGIAIEQKTDVTRFLTSASLVRALNNNKTKNHDCLKIEVRHEGKVVTGFLEEYDLNLEIAVVKITSSLSVHAIFLSHCCQFKPCCDIVSLGRDISGKLIVTTGNLTHDSSGSDEYPMFSSCKLSEVYEGGPLFDYAGEFVGMNLVPSMDKSFFLTVNLIIERLQYLRTSQERTAFLSRVKGLKTVRVGERLAYDIPYYSQPEGAPCKDHHGYLDALGYPRPTDSGMILVNSFEERFGDVYYGGAWDQLSRYICRNLHQSVVSLASFNGDTRFFVCSGIFIDWDGKCQDNEYRTILTSACLVRSPDDSEGVVNKMAKGLRIEVLLPSKERREGTLTNYSLRYNVALISVRVEEVRDVSHALFKLGSINRKTKLVAAVGRCFKSGDLMASSGKLVAWTGPFECQRLEYSTCRITKVGIGGPLIDGDDNLIGMNFYDGKVGTPFLFCDDIVDILDCFKKRTRAEIDRFRLDGDHCVGLSRWPVPLPYWRHPGDHSDEECQVLSCGRQFKYLHGSIWICK